VLTTADCDHSEHELSPRPQQVLECILQLVIYCSQAEHSYMLTDKFTCSLTRAHRYAVTTTWPLIQLHAPPHSTACIHTYQNSTFVTKTFLIPYERESEMGCDQVTDHVIGSQTM
jgi:hypothetical protein